MNHTVVLAIAVVLIGTASSSGQAHYKKKNGVLLPDLSVTKGAIRIRSKTTVCSVKWGKDERHVTQKMKDDAFAAYGTEQGKGVCALKSHIGTKGQTVTEGCEIDHLISRELGGDDKLENLWPQPYTGNPGAHQKDWLENRLHKEVCNGDISLEEAQKEIKTNWLAEYLKRKPTN